MAKGKFSLNFDAIEGLFKPKMPPLIGTDISSSAVKMVEIADAGKGGYCLERYAIEPLPTESVVEGNIKNLDAVIEAVKRCHKRLGSNFKGLALALPNAAVISKKILVPAGQSDDDLGLEVESEANQYIPFSLDEVNLDYQVLGPAPNSPEDVEVLIAASRKDKIEDRVAVAEGAGLKAIVMDVDLFAAQSAFELIEATMPERGHDLNIAVVDIGASTMNVNVLRNDQSIYMRNVSYVVLVQLSTHVVAFIKAEVILSYLGLGVGVDEVSWGTMLAEAQAELILGHWWQLAAATLFMAVFVTAFSLMTDALRDALGPKLRGAD